MTTGAALLSALDAALPLRAPPADGPDGSADGPAPGGQAEAEQQAAGLAAAIGLTELLAAAGQDWDGVMAQRGTRLAKLCGRFGSSYAGERAAAYIHATRLLQRTGARWSTLIRLPPALANRVLAWSLPVLVLPPEDDWLATIRVLQEHGAAADEARLQSLAARLTEGHAIDTAEARWLRDQWWAAEVNRPAAPKPEPAAAPAAGPGTAQEAAA